MERRRSAERVGYGRPPRKTRFKPGASGNPRGRPKGSKNFGTVIAEELDGQVPVTENGRRTKIPMRKVIAKQLVNKAASGDLKATQTLLSQSRLDEQSGKSGASQDVFDTPEDRLVMADIVRRIRLMDELPAPPAAALEGAGSQKSRSGKK